MASLCDIVGTCLLTNYSQAFLLQILISMSHGGQLTPSEALRHQYGVEGLQKKNVYWREAAHASWWHLVVCCVRALFKPKGGGEGAYPLGTLLLSKKTYHTLSCSPPILPDSILPAAACQPYCRACRSACTQQQTWLQRSAAPALLPSGACHPPCSSCLWHHHTSSCRVWSCPTAGTPARPAAG